MKKVLSLLVVLSMLLSILPATVSAAHWADEDVKYLVENGAIAEDDAMLENLDTPITRSQMVKVIVALLEGDEPEEGKEYFTDITAEDTHIAKAAENGFVNGFGDGTFRPNNPITRQDFFTIIGRAYKLEGEAANEFADADSVADYAKPYVDALQSIGIVNGYGDGTVNPRGNITIAETLAVMRRTDEYVKVNTPEEQPKEEEKKPTGSSGGGGGGGFSGGPQNATGLIPAPPGLTFTIELEDDFSSSYVAYATVLTEFSTENMMLLRENGYSAPSSPQYSNIGSSQMDIAKYFGQYISAENGKFALPDFGEYELHVPYYTTTLIYKFTVDPPLSSDVMAPELDMEVVSEDSSSAYPLEFKVDAADDTDIARISYVKSTGLESDSLRMEMDFKIHVNGRQIVTGDTFTIDEDGTYYICAMDVNGNCTYRTFTTTTTSDGIKVDISNNEYGHSSFYYAPSISYSFETNAETNGPLGISLNIADHDSNIYLSAYFALQNYLIAPDINEPIEKTAFYYATSNPRLDLSKDIETLANQNRDKNFVCVIKDYYEAVKKDSGVNVVFIEDDTINLTKNGVYYICVGDHSRNYTVTRFEVNNIKTASATFEVEHEEDASSEYVAHVTATVNANPNAPVKQMFVVKSDYEPEPAGAYRAYTPNGKAQKIWDEVSVSGEYIPVEESKFSISEYGTYSLYMLDEYGNWGVSEVTIEEPAPEPEPDITES